MIFDSDSIIGRDIQFYQTSLEEVERRLRTCLPEYEKLLTSIKESHVKVIKSLQELACAYSEVGL